MMKAFLDSTKKSRSFSIFYNPSRNVFFGRRKNIEAAEIKEKKV